MKEGGGGRENPGSSPIEGLEVRGPRGPVQACLWKMENHAEKLYCLTPLGPFCSAFGKPV